MSARERDRGDVSLRARGGAIEPTVGGCRCRSTRHRLLSGWTTRTRTRGKSTHRTVSVGGIASDSLLAARLRAEPIAELGVDRRLAVARGIFAALAHRVPSRTAETVRREMNSDRAVSSRTRATRQPSARTPPFTPGKSAMRAPRPRECVPHAPALSTRPVGYPAKLRYLLNYCSSRDKTPAARTPTSAFFPRAACSRTRILRVCATNANSDC